MVAQNEARTQVVVARAVVGDVTVQFYDDGSAVMVAALTVECPWCGAYKDTEGEPVHFTPDRAWHMLQAVRQHLGMAAYREATKAIEDAINGPEG